MKKEIEQPFNGGTWSVSRMRSFAMSALRRAQWPQKYKSIDKAFIGNGINPKTGKPCKLHKCPICEQVLPKGEMRADHINPVIPLDHNWENCFLGYDWTEVLRNLWCEADGYQAICLDCHSKKSKQENTERKQHKNDKLTATARICPK